MAEQSNLERVHLLVSAGRGPVECAWAVAQLVPRMEREAAQRKLVCRRVQTTAGERSGTVRSVLVMISGAGAGDFAQSWSGTLCWQAPSPFRPSTDRKNWYVVAQLCDVDAPRMRFEESDVDIVPCRTGGPGGQHRNKVSTAVRATHRPTGMVVVVDTERQFGQNRRLALLRLRERLEQDNRAADDAVTTARWQIHDTLVRGNPTRVVRPEPAR
jgi:peptide chain release factor